MKGKFLKLLIVAVCIIFIIGMINRMMTIPAYQYGSLNTDFYYVCNPTKGCSIEVLELAKQEFDKRNQVNSVICRRFSKNYLKVWNYFDYWIGPYYKYPHCE